MIPALCRKYGGFSSFVILFVLLYLCFVLFSSRSRTRTFVLNLLAVQCGSSPSAWCVCPDGLRNDAEGVCREVNECDSGEHLCPPNADCLDARGGYECRCKPGYWFSGTRCLDIDECLERLDSVCMAGTCVNEPGSFRCECPPGTDHPAQRAPCRPPARVSVPYGIPGKYMLARDVDYKAHEVQFWGGCGSLEAAMQQGTDNNAPAFVFDGNSKRLYLKSPQIGGAESFTDKPGAVTGIDTYLLPLVPEPWRSRFTAFVPA
eukprot:TRINITY_DN32005_c0_g1_i1.p1 TRINITY_DN32005_c0_g1~~TRINITY_DN32005_c0_g1_i1.p1  ORF type:complete len:261 (-),score=48.12 TRINITY_DN32005_c0_g1_i1:42-824(-)